MKRDGVEQVVYLGGLGEPATEHLRSRHETATTLGEEGPPLTYLRAAMVVGEGSESWRTLYHLVNRLPLMIAPAWLRTRTQPIGIDDVLGYLRRAPHTESARGREIQIGGPDVSRYADMVGVVARELGRREPPMVPVPLLTAVAVVAVDRARHAGRHRRRPAAGRGPGTETVVTDPSGAALFDFEPAPFAETVRRALARARRPAPRRVSAVVSASSSAAQRVEVPAEAAFAFYARRRATSRRSPRRGSASGSRTPDADRDAGGRAARLPAAPARHPGPVAHADRGMGAAARGSSTCS